MFVYGMVWDEDTRWQIRYSGANDLDDGTPQKSLGSTRDFCMVEGGVTGCGTHQTGNGSIIVIG